MIPEKNGCVANRKQLYSIRQLVFADGKARGSRLIEVRTRGGLSVDILPDNCLDIGQVFYKGNNMSFMTKNGYDSPVCDMPYETEFTNTFPGGLLYSCGLRSVGPANRDKGEWHPLHGRIHSLPAEEVSAREEDGRFIVSGVMRETTLFGHLLEMRRTISIDAEGSSIEVHDRVTNLSYQPQEYMQTYHCNFGYPLLSPESRLILPEQRRTSARTDFAKTGLGQETTFTESVPGEEERCFFHEDMAPRAALENKAIGVRMDMEWSPSLPILVEWRMMASGDYALGIEPSNSYIMGRANERENGTLRTIAPFESVENEVKFAFTTI